MKIDAFICIRLSRVFYDYWKPVNPICIAWGPLYLSFNRPKKRLSNHYNSQSTGQNPKFVSPISLSNLSTLLEYVALMWPITCESRIQQWEEGMKDRSVLKKERDFVFSSSYVVWILDICVFMWLYVIR